MVWCWFDKELNPNFDWDWAWQFQFFQNISNVMMGKRTSRISGILRISRIRLLLGITKISGKLRISDILTLFVPTLLDSSRVLGGGQISPPLNYCHHITILIFLAPALLCNARGSRSGVCGYVREYVRTKFSSCWLAFKQPMKIIWNHGRLQIE